MENCLVIKLKELVDNSNLPNFDDSTISNELVIGLLSSEYRAYGNNIGGISVCIASGNESVEVEFAIDAHKKQPNDVLNVRNDTIASNTVAYYNFGYTTLPNNSVDGFITIKGGIDELKAIGMYGYGNVLNLVPNNFNNMADIVNYDGLKIFCTGLAVSAGTSTQTELSKIQVPDSIEYLILSCIPTNVYIDNLITDNLKIITSTITAPVTDASKITRPAIVLSSTTAQNESIEIIDMRCSGDIINLPLNTKSVLHGSTVLTGTIESFVSRARNNGRTSGFLLLEGTNVTLNGVTLGSMNASTKINGIYSLVVWNADSITIDKSQATSLGVDAYINFPDVYNYALTFYQ